MTTEEIRAARVEIVHEAASWIGTPYRLGQAVKGAGVDCSTLLFQVYRDCGLVSDEKLGVFSHDWFCHTESEHYLGRVRYLLQQSRLAVKTAEAVAYRSTVAEPGSLVLTKCAGSPRYNHGGIVLRWPHIVHAVRPAVEMVNAATHGLWMHQPVVIFDPYGEAGEAAA